MKSYRLIRTFTGFYLRLRNRLQISGLELVPTDGPLIICANHTSYFDSMLLALCTRRPVRFLITERFYTHPLMGKVIQRCRAIPVTEEGVARHALRKGLEALAKGEVIGIFPEGRLSRTGRPGHGEPGAALLAAASSAPIVPVSIKGAFGVYPKGQRFPGKGKIELIIHPPMQVEAKRKDRAYLREITDQLMATIAQGV